MKKTENDVLNEWVLRGYVTEEEAAANSQRFLSFIRQAGEEILNFCNIPVCAPVPDGLFYVWTDYSHDIAAFYGAMPAGGSDGIKSISEGDTTITFADTGSFSGSDGESGIQKYRASLYRYRRLA
jgi:hypothetical protein